MNYLKRLIGTAAVVASLASCVIASGHIYYPPEDEKVVEKLEQWQDLKFGLMMHWGAYSVIGVTESWTICPEDWCRGRKDEAEFQQYVADYVKLPYRFNPVKFDPDRMAAAAKDAGMRYVVFTTKHHDGFCMFDTKTTDYKITNPAYPFAANPKANISKEIFDSFRDQDFMIGAYFSKSDWHSPWYWHKDFPVVDRNVNYNPKRYPNLWNNFIDYTSTQIDELMSDYGKIDLLWLDGGQVQKKPSTRFSKNSKLYDQDIKIGEIVRKAREKQPGLISVDREVVGREQNYLTPEQRIPDHYIGVPWETCMTISGAWSHVPNDTYKSTTTIIHNLCDIVAKGGSYLLNVAPMANGDLEPVAWERLREIGEWMDKNSEAIYGTRPIRPYRSGDYAFTQKDQSVYAIYLFEQLSGQVNIPYTKDIKSVKLLGEDIQLTWVIKGNFIEVVLPSDFDKKSHAWVFQIN
ncbi:MAG: alpha-L-fucosidase [Spirochaetales bacterium]|nr:alpha-L-fucosidase [Spirochaetales bacterium]